MTLERVNKNYYKLKGGNAYDCFIKKEKRITIGVAMRSLIER